ncbi:MAG: ABC transporter ATP-binding protein/permease [Oscillospiraceae bacterium]|nr:ABC transporter ATP-binding protein/permease [Oscillospiraceae bacterium]
MFKILKEDLKLIKRGLNMVSKIEPYLMTLKIIRSVFNAFVPFINIYMSGLILNELAGSRELRRLIFLVSLTIGLNFLSWLIIHGMNKFIEFKNDSFGRKYEMTLSEKILSMDYQDVENSEIHMKRQRIEDMRNMNSGGLWRVVNSFESIVTNFLKILFAIAITYNVFVRFSAVNYKGFLAFINSYAFSVIMILVIIGNVIFSMYLTSAGMKKMLNLGTGFLKLNRFMNYYYSEYAGTYQAGKDIRIYNQKDFLMKENEMNMDGAKPITNLMAKSGIFYGNLGSVSGIFISGIVYVFVGLKALLGIFEVGSIVQYIGSINEFIGSFSGFMSELTQLRTNNIALGAYFEFMDLPNDLRKGTLPVEKRDDNEYEIEFKNVSFKYPGSENYALKNLSMKFKIGQRLAVVGMNGSGKTTMIKLLCRLYDPTEGEITLNGFNIKKYNYSEYMSVFSVVFQDFKLFSFSLGQNVAASVDYDKEKAVGYLDEAGFSDRFAKLDDGLETPLYKDFDEKGVEISGGEAQKIALARALYKNAPFIVLDEPTAALDPIAEFEVYSKFNEIVGGKTAIYISHRLSSCRFCDDIAVFHEGELIQRGSHDALIADESGKYHELWHAQAQYYAENKNSQIMC